MNKVKLIDADAVDKIINEQIERTLSFAEHDVLINVKYAVYELPPSYDTEKVIGQLKEDGCIIDDDAGNRAVKIILKGGVE